MTSGHSIKDAIGHRGELTSVTITSTTLSVTCQLSNDVGAFYQGRDWTSRGTYISYNYFHDIIGNPNPLPLTIPEGANAFQNNIKDLRRVQARYISMIKTAVPSLMVLLGEIPS